MDIIRISVNGFKVKEKEIPIGAKAEVIRDNAEGAYVKFRGIQGEVLVPNDVHELWEPCHSCNLLRINGVVTHEIGCPEAWRDEVRKCNWCGTRFLPKNRYQQSCDDSCAASYAGVEIENEVA
ncbi:MAG: hypothetical protein IMZ61_16410 [Planctomycetes bacterium]|nr:hypothetical protein [Chloroflexota bacterium]MBE3145485.1 hypothetical protein [Planctomycetota bacterium]